MTLTDYDYLQPSLSLGTSAAGKGTGEEYDYPGNYTKPEDGERYALPSDSAQFGLYYNRALFDAYNASHPDDPLGYPNAEWTWEMRQSGSLPPGASLWWRWRYTDSPTRDPLAPLPQLTSSP